MGLLIPSKLPQVDTNQGLSQSLTTVIVAPLYMIDRVDERSSNKMVEELLGYWSIRSH